MCLDEINDKYRVYLFTALKLVRTNLNYRVLGTSTTAIFLSNYHSLYAPKPSDECHA